MKGLVLGSPLGRRERRRTYVGRLPNTASTYYMGLGSLWSSWTRYVVSVKSTVRIHNEFHAYDESHLGFSWRSRPRGLYTGEQVLAEATPVSMTPCTSDDPHHQLVHARLCTVQLGEWLEANGSWQPGITDMDISMFTIHSTQC